MCAPKGNSEFCFLVSMFHSTSSRENRDSGKSRLGKIETRENKTHYFPREYTLSALLYSKERKIDITYDNCVSRYHDNKSKIL